MFLEIMYLCSPLAVPVASSLFSHDLLLRYCYHASDTVHNFRSIRTPLQARCVSVSITTHCSTAVSRSIFFCSCVGMLVSVAADVKTTLMCILPAET